MTAYFPRASRPYQSHSTFSDCTSFARTHARDSPCPAASCTRGCGGDVPLSACAAPASSQPVRRLDPSCSASAPRPPIVLLLRCARRVRAGVVEPPFQCAQAALDLPEAVGEVREPAPAAVKPRVERSLELRLVLRLVLRVLGHRPVASFSRPFCRRRPSRPR